MHYSSLRGLTPLALVACTSHVTGKGIGHDNSRTARPAVDTLAITEVFVASAVPGDRFAEIKNTAPVSSDGHGDLSTADYFVTDGSSAAPLLLSTLVGAAT